MKPNPGVSEVSVITVLITRVSDTISLAQPQTAGTTQTSTNQHSGLAISR